MNGYSHPAYAASFAEFGTPRFLPHCRGRLLERTIPETPYRDAMGCYPLFACEDWSKLRLDLDEIGDELVTVALVTDPFGEHTADQLHECFPERVTPFKEHLVTDLSRPAESFVNAHHRHKALKALERVNVERCEDPTMFAAEWNGLYANLVRRHSIRGLLAFSESTFRAQLAVPGISAFRATDGDDVLGMILWYADRGVAYYHLGAYSQAGYDSAASFALFWRALEYFQNEGLQWLSLGAGAGVSSSESDGLSRFKRGWSTGMRWVYFCGRVLNTEKYDELTLGKPARLSGYFPAYRKGEFS